MGRHPGSATCCAALLAVCHLLASAAAAQVLEAPVPEVSGGGALAGHGVQLPPSSGVEMAAPQEPLSPPPVVSTTFTGFGFDDNTVENGALFIPPDPMGAAGTDRLVAVVNAMIEARTKAGALLWRDSLASFFTSVAPANALFDPKVIYDHYEGRFLIIALEKVEPGITNPSAGNTSRLLLAVSKTATPATATAADWWYTTTGGKFVLGGIDYWSDYPGFEVDEEAVYITNNLFTFAPAAPGYGGVRLWIVNKGVVGGFYAGGATTVTVHDPYAGGGTATTTMPCQVYGAGGVGPGIGTFLVSYSSLTAGGVAAPEFAQVVRVDAPLGAVTFTQEFVSVGDLEDVGGGFGFPAMPDAPQLGTATLIEVNDSRALDCVWRSGRIWFTTTITPNAGADSGQATAHWIRLDTSAIPAPITLSDQGNIGGEDIALGTYTFFPALAVNGAGHAMFGFSASAPTIYGGAYVTGREAGDTAGTVQASQTVKAGVDYYIRPFGGPRNRWGDYSGMSLDPTNDAVFWVFNEYADTRGTVFGVEDGRWGTAWGRSGFTPGTTTTSTSTSSTTTTSMPTCSSSPLGGCIPPTKGILLVKETVPGKEKVKAVLKQLVPAVSQSQFGDPVNGTTAYNICLYNDTATLIADLLVDRAGDMCGVPPGPCWSAISTSGYKYVDKEAASDGMQKLIGKGGDPLKGKVVAKAANNAALGQTSLPTGIAAQLLNNYQATVQVVVSDGSCFGVTVTNLRSNNGTVFKATEP